MNATKDAVFEADHTPGRKIPETPPPLLVSGAPCPPPVRVAGMIWAVLGCLIALDGVVAMARYSSIYHRLPGGAVLQLGLQVLIGVFFLATGVQTLRGAARDMLLNGIASLAFTLLGSFMAAWLSQLRLLLMAEVYASITAMLLAAGVLALAGRRRYKTWRILQKLKV